MILERTLALLLIATLPLGGLGCGMDFVATGDPGGSGAPGAGGRPAAGGTAGGGAGDAGAAGAAGEAAPGKGDAAAAPEAATTVIVGVGAGSIVDAGGLAICRERGTACAVTTECCAGLSCKGEDEDRRCD